MTIASFYHNTIDRSTDIAITLKHGVNVFSFRFRAGCLSHTGSLLDGRGVLMTGLVATILKITP